MGNKGCTKCQFSSNHLSITTFLLRASRSKRKCARIATNSAMLTNSSCVSLEPNLAVRVLQTVLSRHLKPSIRFWTRFFSSVTVTICASGLSVATFVFSSKRSILRDSTGSSPISLSMKMLLYNCLRWNWDCASEKVRFYDETCPLRCLRHLSW